ncbi:MAG: NADH-quinone oxidoreductase subunit J family protein [Burkholderiaceae bacterium]
MNDFLGSLDTTLLYIFAFCALIGSILVVALQQPMRVATALISTMIFLGGVYGLLGVHFIAAFQVLIYVGAVMVFMVYVIMLLDPRDPALKGRFSPLVVPGIIAGLMLAYALVHAVNGLLGSTTSTPARFGLKEFSVSFLNEYWLHFELTSVLLLAAVVAAVAVIKGATGRIRG